MSRTSVAVRLAVPADVPTLRQLWSEVLRRCSPEDQESDLLDLVVSTTKASDRQVVVVELEGQVAGAVLLAVTTITPLNLEPAVYVISPHVLPAFRRRGVGTALIDAAARFAEERGIGHVATAAHAESRESNRFLARIGLAPQATFRVATTATVRAGINAARHPSRPLVGNHVEKVLAARRVRRERV